jgi:hypothetical protein
MKKVITFSLWGNKPIYTIGAIKNAELVKDIYPEFECWFYIHQDTVPSDIIEKLQEFDNVKIILKSGDLNSTKPRMWRFEAIDDPEVYLIMSRDTDTRILLREKLAVEEWLNSGKLFHIMRDHPYHEYKIMAGMFGTKKIQKIPSWKTLIDNYVPTDSYLYDQNFLRDQIYPYIEDDVMIHASFNKYEKNCCSFPIKHCYEYRFVGEYIYEDESRNADHVKDFKTFVDELKNNC